MEKNLAVPYKSQHDGDSFVSNNDCGPATLAMMLEFLGTKISVGEVLSKMGNPKGYTSIPQLAKVALDLGYKLESKVDATFQDVKKYIDRGLPVGVVGGYKYLLSRQDKKFEGSHIMSVVGYRDDDSIYANDPDYWGQFRKDGDHHVYTFEEFNNFWRNEGNREGNQANILFALIPIDPAPKVDTKAFPKKVVVNASLPLRARTEPILEDRFIAKRFNKGTELDVVGSVQGANPDGTNNVWYLVVDEPRNLYVWSGAVAAIDSTTPVAPPPPAPVVEEKKVVEEKPQISADIAAISDGDAIEQMRLMYQLAKDYLEEHNALPKEDIIIEPVANAKKGFMQALKDALHIK